MSDVPITANGVNGQLTLVGERIRISRRGAMAFLTQGLKGEKDIAISSITSIQWKNANWVTRGYIQFSFQGGAEAKGGAFQAASDENSILFSPGQQREFQAIREAIERRMHSSATASSSVADEIKK